MANNVTWPSIGGKLYTAELCEFGQALEHKSGVYIFCRPDDHGAWHALYVGECENFDTCLHADLVRHPHWGCIKKHGATHVSVIPVEGGKLKRLAIESDLSGRLDPPCNKG